MILGSYYGDGSPVENVDLHDKGRIFELEACFVKHPRSYPRYNVVHDGLALCETKEAAEKIMKDYLQDEGDCNKDLYCFYIYERVLDVKYDRSEYMACWLYDNEGKEIDKRTFPSYWSEKKFEGRNADEIRFKFGELAELYDGDTVTLVWVLASPRKSEWYVQKTIEEGKPYRGDISDDSYIVIDGPGYDWHLHVDALELFKPHFPIPQKIIRKYEKIWAGYLDDRRECYGEDPTECQI